MNIQEISQTIRKKFAKKRIKEKFLVDIDAEADEDDDHHHNHHHHNTDNKNDITLNDNNRIDEETSSDGKDSPEPQNGEIVVRAKNLTILEKQEISNSQQNFFRMLDQKIEEGPDYDSSSETEMALEEARLNALVHHWESASLTASLCSSTSRSLQGTPVRQAPLRQQLRNQLQQPLAISILNQSQHLHHQQLLQQQHQQQQQHYSLQQQAQQQQHQQIQQHQQQLQQQLQQQQQQPQQLQQQQQQQQQQSQQQQQQLNMSPRRGDNRTLLSQTIIHQSYGVAQQPSSIIPNLTRQRILGSGNVGGGTVNGTGVAGNVIAGSGIGIGILPAHLPMAYYTQQPPPQSYFGEVLHPLQVPQPMLQQQQSAEQPPRFPPVISVQRLAPQLQRQLRETQELIRDSCPQLYAAGYGSTGPPPTSGGLRIQQRPLITPLPTATTTLTRNNVNNINNNNNNINNISNNMNNAINNNNINNNNNNSRPPTLEPQYSKELS